MSESSVDLWINKFKAFSQVPPEQLEQIAKSERGFWLYDIKEKMIYLSDGFEYLVAANNNLAFFLQKIMAENELAHLLKVARESIQSRRNGFSLRVKLKDDRLIFICCTILYEKDEPLKIAGTFEDVTPHVACDLRLNRYVELIAYYDDVTGLPNRNYLREMLNERLKRSKESGSIFWLMFIEVSNFSYINELFGHTVGDEFLKSIALEIKKFLPRD